MNSIAVKFINLAKNIERFTIVTIFMMMTIIFFFGIIVRELPSSIANNFSWIEEIVGMMNIYLVFITLGLALEKGKHVKVPILIERLGKGKAIFITKLIDIIGLAFTTYLFFISIKLVTLVFESGQKSPILDISMAIIYMAPSIGFLLVSLRYFFSLIGVFNRFTINNK